MAVTFPNSPTLGQEYTAENGLIYIWDGEKWKTQGSYAGDEGLYILKDGSNTAIFADQNQVGIGTTTPQEKLDVSSSNGPALRLSNTGDNTSPRAGRVRFAFDDGVGAGIAATRSSGDAYTQTFMSFRTGGDTNAEERVRLSSSGLFGIGATVPSYRLEVSRLAGNWTGASPVSGTTAFFHNGNNSNNSPSYLAIGGGSTSSSGIFFGDTESADSGRVQYFHSDDSLRFNTNGSEKVRIDSNGYMGVGQSSPLYPIHILKNNSSLINCTRNSAGNATIMFNNSNNKSMHCGTNSSNDFCIHTSANMDVNPYFRIERADGKLYLGDPSPSTAADFSLVAEGRVQTNGTYNATSASAANLLISSNGLIIRSTSSARFKTNVETMEDSYADAILDARPVWYNSTASEDTAHPDWGYWGFIAEEIEEIDPRLVHYGEDEKGNLQADGIQYERFVPHLVNLVKRQQEAIEALESRVAELEGN